MGSHIDLSVVIPCFNEEESLPELQSRLFPVVQAMRASMAVEVILVDDGSSDDTFARLTALSLEHQDIRVLRHDKNRGLGAALKTGMQAASGKVIVTTDSDGTYDFSEIPRLVSLMVDGVDIVTASPYHPAGGVENVPGYRLVLSKGASFLYRLIASRNIHTYTSLFRAYRAESIKGLKVASDDFLFVTELLVLGVRAGLKVVEYPTTLRVRRTGASKARIARIIRDHLRFQLKLLTGV